MDGRRVLALAKVLVASQMRSGRSTSTPSDFWGRPLALAVVDVAVFLVVLAGATEVIGIGGRANPEFVRANAPLALAFLPLLVLGAVLLAGILFEMSTSSRFTSSDAANWLPISPVEYVAGSSLAATAVYSLAGSVALGVGVAFSWYTGDLAGLALAAFFIVLAQLQGGLLIEMVRASTQRISSAVSRRTGRVTILLRFVLSVAVILAFELAFNPLILFGALQSFASASWLTLGVPFLWPSRSLLALHAGDLLGSAAFFAGAIALTAVLVYGAATLRSRFWAPAGAELELGHHTYAAPHPGLAALGLTVGESSLVWKDLRGLVRRREMIPVLVVPIVITFVSLLSEARSGSLTTASFGNGFLAVWAPGMFALLLSGTCFGQERRAIQTLYSVPITGRGVFRAKTFSVLLPPAAYAVALWFLVAVLLGSSLRVALGLFLVMAAILPVAAFLGLTFAARFSDFQERPRPRFLSPSAMIGVMLLGLILIFAISIPALVWLYSGDTDPLPLLFPVVVVALSLAVTFRLARSGTDRLMQAIPV